MLTFGINIYPRYVNFAASWVIMKSQWLFNEKVNWITQKAMIAFFRMLHDANLAGLVAH